MICFNLNKDGSFNLDAQEIKLRHAYPGIDGRAICPVGIRIGDNRITYELAEGKVELIFTEDNGTLEIGSLFSGFSPIGHFSPLFNADVVGADRFFTQGFKLGGPTELLKITEIEDYSDSHGIAALGADGTHFLCIHSRDFSRFINRIRLLRRNRTVHTTDPYAKLSIDFQLEYANASDETMPSVRLTQVSDLQAGLTACAREIAVTMKARPVKKSMYLWNSWYYLYSNVTEEKIREYSAAFSEIKSEFPLEYIIIDSGYYTTQGDWLNANYRFPSGMEATAKVIRDAGFIPGIWVGIFMVGDESLIYRDHPDWLLHDKDGNPVEMRRSYSAGIWGQSDHNHYTLDTSHPEAMAYVRTVFRTLYSWGFRFFKTDFINWGVHDSDRVVRHTPGKTSIEYLRDLFAVIREEIHESYWLGCISPLFPFIGYADGMRIGGDVGPIWKDEGHNPINMLQESVGDSYFNGIFWQNDPDVVMLRDFHIALKPTEALALAVFQAISGGIVATSDPIHLLCKERKELFKLIRPDGTIHTPIIPYFGEFRKDIVMKHILDGGRSLVLLFNKTEETMDINYDADTLGIRGKYLYSYTDGIRSAPTESYRARIPAHDCILLFASDRELTAKPENLWNW